MVGPNTAHRRSNEFWLAIAGIVATLFGTAIGGFITYKTTDRQLNAAAKQSSVQFSREQRVGAYTNYIDSVTKLSIDEDLMVQTFNKFPQFVDINGVHSEYSKYLDDFAKNDLYSSAVGLVQSGGVASAHAALAAKHNDMHVQIYVLAIAAEKNDLSTVQAKVKELAQNLDSSKGLIFNFADAAQHDLGLK
jgi:hypothetical protein